MSHVDALSRNPTDEPEDTECADGIYVLMNTLKEEDWLCIAQKQDLKILDIISTLNKNSQETEEEKRIHKEYEVRDGRLFRKDREKLLWVVPRKVRWQILRRYHENLGHPAYAKTLDKVKELYWWPRMRNYVKGYIGSCLECLYNKIPGGKHQGKLNPIDKVGLPFHTLHLDHLGPFVKSSKGNNYILIIVDGFTKFTFLKAVRNTSSIVTAKVFDDVVNFIGPPYRVITDRGTSFTGAAFRKLCKDKNIAHILNATSTARANGQVERVNRYVTPSLASLCQEEDHRDWDKHISRIQWGINNTIHMATKSTPFRLLFNFEPRNMDGDCLQKSLLQNFEVSDDIQKKREKAIDKIRQDQEKQTIRYNKRRARATNFQSGDLILVRREVPSTGESRKLQEKYKGPYIITEKLPYDRYRIEDLPETQRTQRFYKGVVAIDAIKRYDPFSTNYDGDESSETDMLEEEV